MAQIIKIKGNKTNANATPSSLVERELASNLVDRCLFGSDGTSVFKYYTGSTKYFDANGYANNANKLGGQTIDYFASADGVADALDEIIDSLKGYQPLITSTNKLAYSLISGVPTSLKNPNALTINNSAGTAQVSYDGSAVKSLTLTKAMVGLGNVENTALSTWKGTTNITTLGTITSGTWNGTKIANGYLANSAINIGGTSVSLGGSITAATLQANLGLGSLAYKSSLAFADLTDKPTTLGGYGITDWSVTFGDYDVNRRYNAGYYIITNGSNAPTHASYGSLLVMPYRNASGNTTPDFATQIFLPNGDDSGYPNDMFFRTSLGSSWNAWQRVLTDNNYTNYTYSKSTIDTKLSGYLPLSGGTINGNLTVGNSNGVLGIKHTSSNSLAYLIYQGDTNWRVTDNGWANSYNIIHSGNIGSQSVASAAKLTTARTIWGQSFDGTGNVGGNLHLNNSKIYWHSDSANYYIDNYYDGTNSPLMRYMGYSGHRFMTSSGEVMRITSWGNVGIGTNNPQYKLDVNGVIHSNTGIFSDGYVSAKGQNTSSDMRLKNVLNEVVLGVKDIANAPSVRFSWKNGGGVDVGSSAQYWQGLLPDAVKEQNSLLEMQYGNIALLSAIAIAKKVETHEEKLARVEKHEERIARLERENEELRNKIDMMERRVYYA